MAVLKDIVIDARHPASLARFWAAVLDGYEVAAYDDAELERLRDNGVDDPEDDPTVLVENPGVWPRLFFQAVPEPKPGKNRLHLDLVGQVAEFTEHGATIIAEPESPDSHTVLADPEGNEFCVFPA